MAMMHLPPIAGCIQRGAISENETATENYITNVCGECKSALLKTYNHCLSKTSAVCIPEDVEIDGVEDGLRFTSPPCFDIIADPTLKLAAVRNFHAETLPRQTRINLGSPEGNLIPKLFSGSLYKRMLNSKDREIRNLRIKLFESVKIVQNEQEKVYQLKSALGKSVSYYTFADEWQSFESTKLQRDIKILKHELCVIMSYFMNAEAEKEKLIDEVKQCGEIVANSDRIRIHSSNLVNELKSKLHDSYQDYLKQDSNIINLRKQADKGTDAAENRNVSLQKSLDLLTFEFQACARNLTLKQNSLRESEYEITSALRQLEQIGDAKERLSELYSDTKMSLQSVSLELTVLRQTHEQTLLALSKLEAENRAAILKNETRSKFDSARIVTLEDGVEFWKSKAHELEVVVNNNKNEIEMHLTNIKVIVNQKNMLQNDLQSAAIHAEKDISAKNVKIQELTEAKMLALKQVKGQEDAKNVLSLKIADLKTMLEKEIYATKSVNFELAHTRRDFDEKTASSENEVIRLTNTVANISKDKLLLNEKFTEQRALCGSLSLELSSYRLKYDAECAEAKLLHTKHIEDHEADIAIQKFTSDKLLESSIKLSDLLILYEAKCDKFESQKLCSTRLKDQINSLESQVIGDKEENAKLVNAVYQMEEDNKIATNSALLHSVQNGILKLTADAQSTRNRAYTRKLLETSSELAENLITANNHISRYISQIASMAAQIDKFSTELPVLSESLALEKEVTSLLHLKLHKLRTDFTQESSIRNDLERLALRYGYRHEMIIADEKLYRGICTLKLEEVSNSVSQESQRLQLFLSKFLGIAEPVKAEGKQFEWLFGTNPFAHSLPGSAKSNKK